MHTCSINNCDNPPRQRGWCSKHYARWRTHGDPEKVYTSPPCKEDNCTAKSQSRGLCKRHYSQWRRRGTTATTRTLYKSPEESFAARTEWQGDCLVWVGATNRGGYGRMTVGGKTSQAHRWAYERVHGPIPKGLVIDHMCHNPPCVNHKHLRAVTTKQNNENKQEPHKNSRSGYRNVLWHAKSGRWRVELRHEGRRISGGYFTDLDDANRTAIALRLQYQTCNDYDRA